MKRQVLVLNQDYSPITICSIYRGFLLVYLNKAELIKPFQEALHSIDKAFPMPAVIKISRYVNVPFKGVMLNRHNIFKRDAHTCQYCGSNRELTVDHVLPSSRGGKSSWANLVTACKRCNSRKGDFTPEEAGMPLFRIPYKPSYTLFLRDHSGYICEEWEPFLVQKVSANF
jgi:hypothetical protein